MDFQKLKHLLAVVEHGTFSRAAEAVNLSQPALSRSIQALETELGLPLLDRGTRQLRSPLRRLRRGSARAACATKRPSYSANSSACTAANPATSTSA